MACLLAAVLWCPLPLAADELNFSIGGGPQVGSDQNSADRSQINTTFAIDYSFFRHVRSARSAFDIGVSYTYMRANTDEFDEMHAVSIYPQLTMYPTEGAWIRTVMPRNTEPLFYVRALGPSYISANRLGFRQQANHFSFQAQIGVGAIIQLDGDRQAILSLSWKHFSNANLFDDNDGIDLPFVLNWGMRF